MLVTALNGKIGYDRAARVAKAAYQQSRTLKQVAVEQLGFLTGEEFDTLVVPRKMVAPKPLGGVMDGREQIPKEL